MIKAILAVVLLVISLAICSLAVMVEECSSGSIAACGELISITRDVKSIPAP